MSSDAEKASAAPERDSGAATGDQAAPTARSTRPPSPVEELSTRPIAIVLGVTSACVVALAIPGVLPRFAAVLASCLSCALGFILARRQPPAAAVETVPEDVASLRFAAARERMIRRHAGDPILLLTTDGTIVNASAAMTEVSGYRSVDLEGRKLAEIIAHVSTTLIGDTLGSGRDVRIRCDNGELRRARLRLEDLSEAGHSGLVAFLYPERAAGGAAGDETAGAGAGVGNEFDYAVSHDLGEPLKKIQGFASLLQKRYAGKLGEDADDYLTFIVDATTRMHRLIQDLLDVAHAGRQERPFDWVESSQLVDAVISEMAPQLSEAMTHVEVASDLPRVQADAVALREVFHLLLDNAVKFHGSDTPHVEISAERHGHSWEFQVTDNGIGLEPRHADRIFGVFQRLHPRTEYEGSGIGLAICRRIIERHGGDLWVDSEPEQGATFHFTLPDRETTPNAEVAVG